MDFNGKTCVTGAGIGGTERLVYYKNALVLIADSHARIGDSIAALSDRLAPVLDTRAPPATTLPTAAMDLDAAGPKPISELDMQLTSLLESAAGLQNRINELLYKVQL